jgi:hypothetical protein
MIGSLHLLRSQIEKMGSLNFEVKWVELHHSSQEPFEKVVERDLSFARLFV